MCVSVCNVNGRWVSTCDGGIEARSESKAVRRGDGEVVGWISEAVGSKRGR